MTFDIIRYSIVLLLFFCITSCKQHPKHSVKKVKYQINYLDEQVIYNDSIFANSKIGGLSGIEYNKEKENYYIVCDDAKLPRFYTASITLIDNAFDSITIDTVTTIKDNEKQFLSSSVLDLEAIRTFTTNQIIFTSEGAIKHGRNPFLFITDHYGNYKTQFKLPSYFSADSTNSNIPRHNGVLEGLTKDVLHNGFWTAMELPLQFDGKEPSFSQSGAPVRITHFDNATLQYTTQFTYPLDKLAKDPKDKFGVNGVTDLVQLTTNDFLVLERGYSAGYGNQGNTVRIYLANNANTTNTVAMTSLKDQNIISATKTLLFDFESIRNRLTDDIVDNIEGITLGPKLPNGNQSLILIADNNFNPTAIQINQVILLELLTKKQL